MIGKTISHYKIIEYLGGGGMGIVYKAEDTKLKRQVALKFLPPGLTRDPEAKQRFIHEAQAASALEHPNICNIHEIDETQDGQIFIAMAYYEGEILKKKIEGGPLKLEEAIDIAIQVVEGLRESHQKDIVHRDIKPANIFITDDGIAKILDFGLAKLAGQTKLTKVGTTIGTVSYMSPEQTLGEEIDHRTDIWSLGIVIYEMLTGQLPFKGHYDQAVVYSIINEEPEPITGLRTEIPMELESVVKKVLAKSSDARYQHIKEIMTDLKSIKKEMEAKVLKPSAEKTTPSIAVLPFINMSADKEQDYFCDGMAEEIINALTHIENLRVIARTSAFAFKGKHEDVRQIGKKLDVEHLLEGSVRKAGNRLRIIVQLVKVADGYHLWSERYDRELEDVFDIQDEITLAIVENLKIKLLGKEKSAILKRHTDDLEAYNLYLKGNHYWQMLSIEGFNKALECYEQALQKDPHYALAYFGLASVYCASSYWGNVPPYEAYPKAKVYAKKALKIDETLAEAHTTLGLISTHYDWNWKAAEGELKQALQLNPNSADIHIWYYFFLTITEHHEEAITEAKRAQELDPLSSFISANVGYAFFNARQYDRAIEELLITLTINPNYFLAHDHLGLTYRAKTMLVEAIAEFEKAVELTGGNPWVMMLLATTYYEFGEKAKAEKLFESLKQRSRNEYVPPICFFYIHLFCGDKDQAFEWLERAYNERDSWLLWSKSLPIDSYRIPDEPRFKAIMKKMGLER